MEALVSLGLAANLLQFIECTHRLVANSSELYKSKDGVLDVNRQIESATEHLLGLNTKIGDIAASVGDEALSQLSESCKAAAEELITALNKVKIDDKNGRWMIIRKALQATLHKVNISKLESRLSRFREELNLHILVDLRYGEPEYKGY